jgi:cytochrome c1
MHTADEIGIDDFQASRSPDHRYRTTPLKGLWVHAKGGFYHDGRYPRMTDSEMSDLVEYLKSL